QIRILRANGGGNIAGPVTVAGLADAITNKSLRVAIQAEGQTLRAKVYEPGPANEPNQFEPLDWQVSGHDTVLFKAGGVGVRDGVASGNTNAKPIVFSHTDFEVRLPRFYGELTDSMPSWDETNRVRFSTLLASGIFMRLSQGDTPLYSAPHRFLNTWVS